MQKYCHGSWPCRWSDDHCTLVSPVFFYGACVVGSELLDKAVSGLATRFRNHDAHAISAGAA